MAAKIDLVSGDASARAGLASSYVRTAPVPTFPRPRIHSYWLRTEIGPAKKALLRGDSERPTWIHEGAAPNQCNKFVERGHKTLVALVSTKSERQWQVKIVAASPQTQSAGRIRRSASFERELRKLLLCGKALHV
jgi:hypothetical protein